LSSNTSLPLIFSPAHILSKSTAQLSSKQSISTALIPKFNMSKCRDAGKEKKKN
jgi:hypothetical protein